jgi:hypothetical protein
LSFFLFCQKFENLFIICAKILINLKVQLSGFELQTFNDNDLKLKQFKHIRLLHNIDKTLFIIFYNHYFSKFLELKNQVPKMRFQI